MSIGGGLSCRICKAMATMKLTLMGVIIDVLSLILVFMPTIVIELGHVKPFQRGFYCNDDSIKYPYHENTVPVWIVFVVGIIGPVIFIIATEAFHNYRPRSNWENLPSGYRLTPTRHLPIFVVLSYQIVGIFLFGLAITQAVTDICKYSIGRLRPHFLDVCRPNISSVDCDTASGLSVYIDNFTCTGTTNYAYDDSRLSFLSGHTSISYYCAVFFALYLQARLTWKGSKLLKHLLQAIAIYAAVFVGLSRVSDYKHHWSDVLMGAVLGTFVASLVGIHVSNMFRVQNLRDSDANMRGDCPSVAIENNSNTVMLSINNTEPSSANTNQYLAP